VFLGMTNNVAGPKALAAARNAVALAPDLPEAIAAVGAVQFRCQWKWDAAGRSLQQAIQLQPANLEPYLDYGAFLDAMGRSEDAIRIKKTGLDLDPASSIMHLSIAASYWFLRRYHESLEWCRKAVDLEPQSTYAQYRLASAYYKQGNYDEWAKRAIGLSETYLGHNPDRLHRHEEAYARQGRAGLLRSLLPHPQDDPCDPSAIMSAIFYSELGETDNAFHCLDRAYYERDATLVYLKVDPWWDTLRNERRFDQLLARVRLS
jgi:tetratricopeptide (TPR) repeat protein